MYAGKRADKDVTPQERAAGCLPCGHEFINYDGPSPSQHPRSVRRNILKDISWVSSVFKKDKHICYKCEQMLKYHQKKDWKLSGSADVKNFFVERRCEGPADVEAGA